MLQPRSDIIKLMRKPESNQELVDLIEERAQSYMGGGPRDSRVLSALRLLDRAAFLPPGSRWAAYQDEPADIGLGQTCSQPSMVAFMLEKLEPEPGLRVLEVGAGCGYAAAALALLCSPGGEVVAAELLGELADAARANCRVALASIALVRRLQVAGVEILAVDASSGLAERGPFDRILFSAGVALGRFREAPLLAQLAAGGILLYPEVKGGLHRVRRLGASLLRDTWPGVAFVRLKGSNS